MNWNDGGLPFGSRKVQIYPAGASDASGNTLWTGAAKGIYILEQHSPSRPQKVVKTYNEAGAPNGAVGTDDFVEGSATVQLANVLTNPVATGDAFTTKQRGTGTSESFVVINADEPENQLDVRKQSIRVQKIVAVPSGNLPAVYP